MVEFKVFLFPVFPKVISDLKQVLFVSILILQCFKTRGRVFSDQRRMMIEVQENYYLILFMFASQLYFYVLGLNSLLGYQYFNLGSKIIFVIRQLGFPS